MKHNFFVYFAFLYVTLSVCVGRTIELNSDRDLFVDVDFDKAKKIYTVNLEFAPVVSLSQIENEEMTEILAKFFTEEALSVFLKEEKGVKFSRINSNILFKSKDKIKYRYLIPENEIYKVEVVEETSIDNLLTNYYNSCDETNELFLDARSPCFRDTRTIEFYYLSKISNAKDKTALRKEINDGLTLLRDKIKKDRALFLSEKEELLERVNKIELALLKKLSKNKSLNTSESSNDVEASDPILEVVSSPTFDKPEFKDFFENEKILLTIGGCRAFETEDGKIALISVGLFPVTANSFVQSLKSAEINAYNELAKHQNVQVTYFGMRTKKAEVVKKKLVESSSSEQSAYSKTTIQSKAYIQKMEKVGYWYSKDKTILFVALGCFID